MIPRLLSRWQLPRSATPHHTITVRPLSTTSKANLRKRIRPFLLACHPDATFDTKKMSRQAKDVNLQAVQTLNGLIDTCDEFIIRCTSSGGGRGPLPELKGRYEVEFMLPSNPTGEGSRRKGEKQQVSLRSVVMEFPSKLREEVRDMARTQYSAWDTANRLKHHVEKELWRLLTVAGLEHEGLQEESDTQEDPRQERKQEGDWTLSDHFLYELGIEPTEEIAPQPSAFYGRRNASPPGYRGVQDKRQAFVNSIRWDTFAEKYQEAYQDAKANATIMNMNLYHPNTKEGLDRRRRFVSEIVSRVEIWMGRENQENIPAGLDVVSQLVAIRRLSTILLDNFEYLNMEKMGRMWENLVIVFTPPRNGRRKHKVTRQHNIEDEYADVVRTHSPHPGRKLHKWERKIKKREKATPPHRGAMRRVAEYHYNVKQKAQVNHNADENSQEVHSTNLSPPSQISESGFKFSYGSQADQGTGQVTAYIPIDFGDEEVVKQLHVYLYDYFDNCCNDAGFLKFGSDGNITVNVSGLDEDERKAG